ncbi:MAG: hypothetical protein R2825_13455 [Saprospiraceae bacterium]
MRSIKILIALFFGLCMFTTSVFAYYNPKERAIKPDNNNENNSSVSFREQCVTANRQIDQDVNNVRARLTAGGDVWWNRNDGKYVVPKVTPGEQEISSIFAGAVWLGGLDPGGNLKVACQTYGNSQGQSDFWSGPLNDETGTTDKIFCDQWERFFEVAGSEVQQSLAFFEAARNGGPEYTADMIPFGLRQWPATGNPYFFSAVGFDLPITSQGLAGFWDENLDGEYNPLDGDFPTIEIRGCEEFPDGTPRPPQFPDEMIFWIYNDEGGGAIHGESNGLAIRMEVQVQAFGYATNDEINNMTFQRYKLINRAKEDIDSTYFAMWVDADLGCYVDDYIGCDVSRSLAYTYNEDAFDGDPQCTGIGVYGENVPIIGIDYFRGPLDEFRNELGMSSFTYFNNPGIGNPEQGTTDPTDAQGFYNYLTGTWVDGTPFVFGGDGHDPNSTNYVDYAFVDAPNVPGGWSMCETAIPFGDRRTVQASGPFKLQPGAVNELIIGAVWVPDLAYPCPNIKPLLDADDISQDLFDNCFDLVDGPDAPDVDWIELDQELIAVLTNKPSSNNFNEEYEEAGIGFPGDATDTTYNFEGYLIYQLAGPNVDIASDINDAEKARLIYQVDVKNGISSLYNWIGERNPNFNSADLNSKEFVFYPEVKVEGLDEGIRHTFSIVRDQFATSDDRLINHRRYYFTVLAYAHNEFEPFDFLEETGQKITYLEGRRNIQTYGPIPRPIIDRGVNAEYGEGPVVTRIDGIGVGGQFVDISDETYAVITDNIRNNQIFQGEITYKEDRGPIDVTIYNPLDVLDGEFELTFIDENMGNDELDDEVYWVLTDLTTGDTYQSNNTLDNLNEQIFGQYGFTITVGQTDDVGDWADPTDGAIGYEQTYGSPDKPFWFGGIQNGFVPDGLESFVGTFFTFVSHKENWDDRDHEVLGNIGQGYFVPYQVTDFDERQFPYITPAWRSYGGGLGQLVMNENRIKNTNNVDIVFTSDKSLWSRCVVIETMAPEYRLGQDINGDPVTAEDKAGIGQEILHFDLRSHPSVGKEAGADGLPLPDGDGIGMGWFPGYAIDVETGKRLNIFFGENSAYRKEVFGDELVQSLFGGAINGADMMFNPENRIYVDLGIQNIGSYYVGGQHWVYVTNREYDACEDYRTRLDPTPVSTLAKRNAVQEITWAGMPIPQSGTRLLSYEQGLIPNDVTVKLRVDNPYDVEVGTGDFNGYPTYRFKIEGKEASPLTQEGQQTALDAINVVPNPYYAYSDYENATNAGIVKITNLPAKCVITIYTLDGKFIRQYNRDERPGNPYGSGINNSQIIPDLEWDLKNNKGINVAAGVYLIHVDSEIGERTLKWFGINRKFDPSGL